MKNNKIFNEKINQQNVYLRKRLRNKNFKISINNGFLNTWGDLSKCVVKNCILIFILTYKIRKRTKKKQSNKNLLGQLVGSFSEIKANLL